MSEEQEDQLDAARIRGIVEAVLMTAVQPVSAGKLQSVCKGASAKDLKGAVDTLNETYESNGHAMTIAEVAGGYQFVTRREYGSFVRKFHDKTHVRISQAALETLAIIAFKQPVTRIEVDSIRGVESGGVIRTLLELNMIRIVGRSEGVGRPMLFGTTREFMAHFGLKSLADLPRPKELEELLAEGERKAQARDATPEEGEGEAAAEEPAIDGVTVEELDAELADRGSAAASAENGAENESGDADAPDEDDPADDGRADDDPAGDDSGDDTDEDDAEDDLSPEQEPRPDEGGDGDEVKDDA